MNRFFGVSLIMFILVGASVGISYGVSWIENNREISPTDYRMLVRYEEPELQLMIQNFMEDNKMTQGEFMKVIHRSNQIAETKVNVDSIKQLLREP